MQPAGGAYWAPSKKHKTSYIQPNKGSEEKDCSICAETKSNDEFPIFGVTAKCSHPPRACVDCVQTSIRVDLDSRLWTEISCLECRVKLDYLDIQRHADKQTFERYEALAFRAAMSESEAFRWCAAGCGSGQLHDSGDVLPIMRCSHCGHRSCFTHNSTWHEGMTCKEYDAFLEDPENFRSQMEIDNRLAEEQEDREAQAVRQAEDDARAAAAAEERR